MPIDPNSKSVTHRLKSTASAAEELRQFAARRRSDGAEEHADHLDHLADRLESRLARLSSLPLRTDWLEEDLDRTVLPMLDELEERVSDLERRLEEESG